MLQERRDVSVRVDGWLAARQWLSGWECLHLEDERSLLTTKHLTPRLHHQHAAQSHPTELRASQPQTTHASAGADRCRPLGLTAVFISALQR